MAAMNLVIRASEPPWPDRVNFRANFMNRLFRQNAGSLKQQIRLCPCFWLLYFHNFVQILLDNS